MKRILLSLLVLSVAANGLLLMRNTQSSERTGKVSSKAPAPKPVAKPSLGDAWNQLNDSDLERFAQKLEDQGLPKHLRRALLSQRINDQFAAREEGLKRRMKPRKFWQYPKGEQEPLERILERNRLQLEKRKLLNHLAGPDESWTETMARRYSYASPEKRQQLDEIAEEMDVRLSSLQEYHMGGLHTEKEEQMMKALEAEKTQQVKQLLSPAEYAAYEMQASPEAKSLRWQLNAFDATEAEMNALIQYQKGILLSRQERSAATPFNHEDYKARQAQIEQYDQQLKVSLGEERYAQFVRANQNEFRTLQSMLIRNDMPATTVHEVLDMRDLAMKESNTIYEDKSLTVEQKYAAMKALTNATRTQIESIIGKEMADAYLTANSNPWFSRIEQGRAIKFTPGGGTSSRALPRRPTPPPQPKP